MNTIDLQAYHSDPEYIYSYNQKNLIQSDENINQYFSTEPVAFQLDQSFNVDCYYPCQQYIQDYTPSYGSPESISEYELSSDDYSSSTSVISSPNLTTDSMFYTHQDNADSFDYSQESLYQDMSLDTFQYQDLGIINPSIDDLKLSISCVTQSDDSTDLLQNTFTQCPQSVMFNFVPPTPISSTKDSSLFPYDSSTHSQPIHSSDNNTTSSSSISVPNSQIVNSQIGNTEQQNKQKSLKKSVSSSSRNKVSHRSHRRSLPSDMVERLHTMNLAPPKPSRKSKTCSPFSCPYEDCTKTFTRQYNLKSHLRTHTDERPFLCGYQGCMRAFARQHDRKRHYNLHLGFKPHVCAHCGRAFARLDALNRHLRSDSGAPCAQATLPSTGPKKFKPISM
ncbi:5628_t:CDS:1 [Cetraspora pellucida]|uniref:5628_t:CDS:1 n=1 Tax=Cetraspora pellucida TaxID=1433469 RepID=A0ACA9K8N3_9GLOM|nr:5628_t:CDS:1 [Cetraspora pellucida]